MYVICEREHAPIWAHTDVCGLRTGVRNIRVGMVNILLGDFTWIILCDLMHVINFHGIKVHFVYMALVCVYSL